MPITHTRRRMLAAIIAVAALSAGACSSSDDDDEGANPTTPSTSAAVTTSSIPGVLVTSDDRSFRAVFPVQPDRSEANETAAGIDLVIVSYVAEVRNGAVGVSYSDYPDVPDDPQPVFDGAAEGSASRTGGTITASSDTTYLGRDARDVEIAVDGGTVFERFVLDGRRMYVLLGAGETGRPTAYDRLLDSFELL